MDNKYMELALEEAKKGFNKNEVPVGAVIVYKNKVIAKAYNKRINDKQVISHAEILAVLKANKKLKDWRLNDCDLYVTLKPCLMCEAIIKESRIKNVYYLLNNLKDKKYYDKTEIKQLFGFDDEKIKIYKEKLNVFFENIR